MPVLRIVVITALLVCVALAPAVAGWESLAPGLSYRTVIANESGALVHLVTMDPQRYRVQLLRAADQGQPRQFLPDLIRGKSAIVAINASFFDPAGTEMGLVVREGQSLRPLRRAPWGVFQIRSGRPSILHTSQYDPRSVPDLAVQTGPRLVVNKKVLRFKDERPARRSGLCITPQHHLLIAAASPAPITLTEFARALQPHCPNALNLDGGSSTQFYLKAGNKEIFLPGREPIPNALVVIGQ